MLNLSEKFWANKYETNKIGWDLGEVSPPLKNYFDQLKNKELKILIPGGGNSYEAEYLFNHGFKNVYVIDIAKAPLQNIKSRIPNFPESQLMYGDFFDLEMQFDLVIEQTFFCAIHPKLRAKYAAKMHSILKPEGKLVGLMFDAVLNEDRPPFGGDKAEYLKYFQPYFKNIQMEPCYNSFHNRQGMELFVKLEQKLAG